MADAVSFGPSSVPARFLVDKLPLGHVISPLLRFSPVGVFPPLLHSHLHIAVALTGMTHRRSLRNLKNQSFVGSRVALHGIVHPVSCSIDSSNLPH